MSAGAPVILREFGEWRDGSVLTTWRPTPAWRPANPEVERLVAEAWDAAVRDAAPGAHLFDGPMCRLESYAASPASLRLALSPTSYRVFLGTNMRHPELADRFGRAALANPVGLSTAVVTADGFLLLGRRNGRVAYYPNRVHPFAGALEPPGDGATTLDVFDEVRRELREELGLSPADAPDLACIGLAEDASLRQPELIFRARCANLSCEALEAKLDEAEHGAVFAVRADAGALTSALAEPLLTPVATATILLLGRGAFGTEWFDRAAAGNVRAVD